MAFISSYLLLTVWYTWTIKVEPSETSLFMFQVSREMINYYDSVYDKAMTQSLTDLERPRAAASVLKVFHETVWNLSA